MITNSVLSQLLDLHSFYFKTKEYKILLPVRSAHVKIMQIDNPIISESQKFRQWYVWVLVAIAPIIFVWAILQQVVLGVPFGTNPSGNIVLIILAVVFGIAFPFFLYRTGLDVQLSSEAIHLRFWPLHFKPRTFYFRDIHNVEPVTYSPLKDYGGWGIRYGAKGKAYNVSGNQGVVITLETGQRIMIGSQRHEELSSIINDRL